MAELNINTSYILSSTQATVISVERNNGNGTRSSIILINGADVGGDIYLAIDAEAATFQGIKLSPGGSWTDSRDSGYLPTQKHITAISSVDGEILLVQERVVSS